MMRHDFVIALATLALTWSAACSSDDNLPPDQPAPPDIEVSEVLLGKMIYFDSNLSEPAGQSCASCHSPDTGFAEPHSSLPVSQGVDTRLVGNRNAPSAAYAAFSPSFYFDEAEGLFVGGQFWDGRAATLADQAKGPFLNPVEMGNPDAAAVIAKIRASDYAQLFEVVYGEGALDDAASAYDAMAQAIAAFEASDEVNRFTSKYDAYLRGEATLSEQEMRGLAVFEGPGECAACHPHERGPNGEMPLFTDFTYDNLGVPRNPDNPFYLMPPEFNPDGAGYVDLGLGAVLSDAAENGKMKVPTLRNIALTAPYMHNGVFDTLEQVVDFYNTRDVGTWEPPEVPENVNTDELGDLGLTPEQVEDLVAFLRTLTDGYVP